jgi:small subunit ribosomal protein S9
MAEKYIFNLGRRKSAVAKVRVYPGKGKMTINDKDALAYFSDDKNLVQEVNEPLKLTDREGKYDITIKVSGGGMSGQVEAIKLAIARTIVEEASELRPVLKKAGFLKRDSREKERKKYGLRSARKREQFSKR